jgi:hypothetical protein
MGLLSKNRALCTSFRAQLEDAATAAPRAKSVAELLEPLPAVLHQHAQACAECRQAAEDVLTTRAALSALPSSVDLAAPWFATRVMAAIAARKAELARAADTWTLLPKLAVHFTWASSVALLLASAWLYQRPVAKPDLTAVKPVATDITGEPVVDIIPPVTNDEVLVSLAEKAQSSR